MKYVHQHGSFFNRHSRSDALDRAAVLAFRSALSPCSLATSINGAQVRTTCDRIHRNQDSEGLIMLVLSRHRDESIMIGDDIVITIVDIRGDKVRLGIQAPAHVSVHRQEIYDAIQREKSEGTPASKPAQK